MQMADLLTVVPSSDLKTVPTLKICWQPHRLSPAQYANRPRSSHVHLNPGCGLWGGRWTSFSLSQHSLGTAEGKPAKLGQAVDSEKSLYLGANPSQLQFINSLTDTFRDPEGSCTQLQLPHRLSMPAIWRVLSLRGRHSHLWTKRTRNGLILDPRPLQDAVWEQSCWHRDLAGDTPSCTTQDPEEPYTQFHPHHSDNPPADLTAQGHIRRNSPLCIKRSWNDSMPSSRGLGDPGTWWETCSSMPSEPGL